MELKRFRVTHFRSVEDSGWIEGGNTANSKERHSEQGVVEEMRAGSSPILLVF